MHPSTWRGGGPWVGVEAHPYDKEGGGVVGKRRHNVTSLHSPHLDLPQEGKTNLSLSLWERLGEGIEVRVEAHPYDKEGGAGWLGKDATM